MSDEDRCIELIDELWELVEKFQAQGPGPVLRVLAEAVMSERMKERKKIAQYLADEGFGTMACVIRDGKHAD